MIRPLTVLGLRFGTRASACCFIQNNKTELCLVRLLREQKSRLTSSSTKLRLIRSHSESSLPFLSSRFEKTRSRWASSGSGDALLRALGKNKKMNEFEIYQSSLFQITKISNIICFNEMIKIQQK